MSGKRAPHFAHAPGSDCASGYETAVHLAAKQLIEARCALMFPALTASITVIDATGGIHKPTMQLAAAGQRAITNVVLENAMGQIRPDVCVDTADLGTVLVEVAVTHFVDDDKLARIVQKGVGAIEIDLSTLREATFAALETALFDDPARITWLYHPKTAIAEESLRATIQDKLDEAQALADKWAHAKAEREEAARLERVAQQLADAARRKEADDATRKRRHEELKKASAFKARPEDHKRQILLHRLGVTDLPAYLAADVRGASSFGVGDPLVWQTTLFGGLIHQRPSQGHAWVKREYALAWMRYRFDVAPELSRSADAAIGDYLRVLSDAGGLVQCKNGFYGIAVADLACFEALCNIRSDRGFDRARLEWAAPERWPTDTQVRTLTEAMFESKPKVKEWLRVAELLPGLVERPPLAICDWASSIGGTRAAVLEFLVRTGFIRLSTDR